MWHFASPILVFFSFLDSTVSGQVTQISISYVTWKLRLPVFSEVAKFWKVLINFHKLSPLQDFMQISLRPCLNMLELLFSTIVSFVAPIDCIRTAARFIIL